MKLLSFWMPSEAAQRFPSGDSHENEFKLSTHTLTQFNDYYYLVF